MAKPFPPFSCLCGCETPLPSRPGFLFPSAGLKGAFHDVSLRASALLFLPRLPGNPACKVPKIRPPCLSREKFKTFPCLSSRILPPGLPRCTSASFLNFLLSATVSELLDVPTRGFPDPVCVFAPRTFPASRRDPRVLPF